MGVSSYRFSSVPRLVSIMRPNADSRGLADLGPAQFAQLARVQLRQQQPQSVRVLRVFGIVQRVDQHITNVFTRDQFHVPIGEHPLTHFLARAEVNDVFMAVIASDAIHQCYYIVSWPFQPLKKHAAPKHQQPGNALRRVPAAGPFDDSCHARVIDASRCATAVHRVVQQRKGVAQTGFVALRAGVNAHGELSVR